MTNPLPRDIVGVEVAEAELLAVRDLLAELEGEVAAAEAAALAAEARARAVGSSLDDDLGAVERSRRVVDEMTAVRRSAWSPSYEPARPAPPVVRPPQPAGPRFPAPPPRGSAPQPARTRFPQLPAAPVPSRALPAVPVAPTRAAAAHEPAASPPSYPPVLHPGGQRPAAPVGPAPAPAWPADVVDDELPPPWPPDPTPVATTVPGAAPGPLPAMPARTPALPDHDDHAAFWREQEAASRGRQARPVVGDGAPIEALLPLVAVVIVLAAILLLVG